MKFISKFKNYFSPQKQKNQSQQIQQDKNRSKQLKFQKNSSQSFQFIVQGIYDDDYNSNNNKKIKQIYRKSSQQTDNFQQLRYQTQQFQQPHEQIHNMYTNGIVFINKVTQGRQITLQQWNQMIKKQDLSLQAQKNIYFSILKGIDFSVRKKVWQLLANTCEMKKMAGNKKYQEIINSQFTDKKQLSIIDKDVPRSVNITSCLPQLRNILIAYVNFSGKSYTQGMNLIAGSLLQLLKYQNDQSLNEFGIIQNNYQFQQRVFWVFIGIMKHRNWQQIFQLDLSGLKQMLSRLQVLMCENVPSVYQKIIDYQWDLTIFSQYYITILLYNTPKQFSKVILDLFLLDGENIIHSLIIRMLKLHEDTIIGLYQQAELMEFFKKKMLQVTFDRLQKDKQSAQKLEDFQINFMESNCL